MPQQVILQSDRFYEIKKLLKDLHYDPNRANHTRAVRSNNDPQYRYKVKERSRLERQKLMQSDYRFFEFFNWVFDLRKKAIEAKLIRNSEQFGKLIGVSRYTIAHWKNWQSGCGGHFPSDKALKSLQRLEVILLAKVEVTKSKANIKSKKFPNSRIKIPKLNGNRKVMGY